MTVRVTCDRCDRELPEAHVEVFRYVVDDDDGDIVELGFDFCSPKCHWEQAEVWYLETTVGT